jgi:uncharacterized protein (DUF885 family)
MPPRRGAFVIATVCAVFVGLAACRQEAQRRESTASRNADQDLAELLRDFTRGYYDLAPTAAVNAGLHEYDGRLPDFSPEAIQARVAWLEKMRQRTAAIDADRLGKKERLYRDYLAVEIDTQLFHIQTLRVLENNCWFDYLALDPNLYLSRQYAPLTARMDAYTRHVEALPAVLAAMRRTMKPMPSGHAEGFEAYVSGLATFVTTAPDAVFAPVKDPARQTAMKKANDRAAAALKDLAQWIKASPRNEEFALGPKRYTEMLRALERIDTPVAELKSLAERDLERNRKSLERACAAFAPGSSLTECRAKVAARKPSEGPVAAATRQVDQLKKLVLDRKIVSIPADLVVIVAEAPPHQRSATAYISVPGPRERDMPSMYYISPPDPKWPVEEQRQYVQSEADLMTTTTHCVWTGHILETARSNASGNPLSVFTYSYAYTEGWSCYSEEMMLHEALDDDPEMAIGQLQNALLGNVRILASIGLHTGGMTIKESERLFLEKAFSDPQSARQEAVRGTFDPGYLFYSLGKLMIVKLRDDWLAVHPESSLRDFHEAFLSYGDAPVKLVRKAMLGDADNGKLFH